MGEGSGAPPARARLRHVIAADLFRYTGQTGVLAACRQVVYTPAFRYTLLWRCCQHLQGRLPFYPVYALLALWLIRVGRLYGISIPVRTRVGPGLYIGHYGGIVVNPDAVIGSNCNLSPGVVIGQTNRGPRQGVPRIGHRVYLGPGAKIIGAVHVGNGAAVGANAVVTTDVPDSGVAVGVPARVVSLRGSEGYIQHPVPAP